jgi:chromosome segregation ATPase
MIQNKHLLLILIGTSLLCVLVSVWQIFSENGNARDVTAVSGSLSNAEQKAKQSDEALSARLESLKAELATERTHGKTLQSRLDATQTELQQLRRDLKELLDRKPLDQKDFDKLDKRLKLLEKSPLDKE